MTFRALLFGKPIIFKRAKDGGRWQLLADALKRRLGLNSMGADRFKADFDFRLQKGQELWEEGTFESFKAPETWYLLFEDSKGVPLLTTKGWQKSPATLQEYLEIALFRYGTLRFKDLHPGNVLRLPKTNGSRSLLSIDEMSVGREALLHAHAAKSEFDGLQTHLSTLQNIISKWQQVPKRSLEQACLESGFGSKRAKELADEIAANLSHLLKDLDAAAKKGKTSWRGQPSRTQ
ncbi:hypothetical protein WJX74_011089 [Apatococcus lobatus]|uniref:Uncharacterized protein n=1 Tax=Apatococcus lobatus TaxID=904363 RepID=A0AAW1Q8C0_9CHLO